MQTIKHTVAITSAQNMTSDIEAEAKQREPSVPIYGTLQIHSISSLYMPTAALYLSLQFLTNNFYTYI
jgi:hypothetical protein